MISFEPVCKKFNCIERYTGVIHSLQVDTFLIIFEITSSLTAGERKNTSEGVKDAVPSRSLFLRVPASANLASRILVTRKGGEKNKELWGRGLTHAKYFKLLKVASSSMSMMHPLKTFYIQRVSKKYHVKNVLPLHHVIILCIASASVTIHLSTVVPESPLN